MLDVIEPNLLEGPRNKREKMKLLTAAIHSLAEPCKYSVKRRD